MGSKRKYDDTVSASYKGARIRKKPLSRRNESRDESRSSEYKRRKISTDQKSHPKRNSRKSRPKKSKSHRDSEKAQRRGMLNSSLSKLREGKSEEESEEEEDGLSRKLESMKNKALSNNCDKLVSPGSSNTDHNTRLDEDKTTLDNETNRKKQPRNKRTNDITWTYPEILTSSERRLQHRSTDNFKENSHADEVLDKNFRWAAASLNNMTRKICSNSINSKIEKHFVSKLSEIIHMENKDSAAKYDLRIGNSEVLRVRCAMLERQLGSLESQWKSSKGAAQKCEKVSAAFASLQKELETKCEHNTALLRELSEVKKKFQEQIADKVEEIAVLNDERGALTANTKEIRGDVERKNEQQRLNYEEQLNNLRASHAKAVRGLKAQYKGLSSANSKLFKRNKELNHTLNRFKIEPPVSTTKRMTPGGMELADTLHSALREDLIELEQVKGSETELAILKADAASLRVSLETKTSQLAELHKLHELYVILSGVSVTKNDLCFDCKIANPEEEVKFDFSLFNQDDGKSILYEKVSWDGMQECPKYLKDCSGQFFSRNLAPLFLKNIIKEVFLPRDDLHKRKSSVKDKPLN